MTTATPERMRILVTNDDGVYSPGLWALAKVAAQFGHVRVVAPDVEQSAMGHAITILRPLRYRRAKIDSLEAYRVDGTPADCVALGLHHWDGADLVLSGINLGSNLGHDLWHSGTVAAARQAAFLGVRAAAFSLSLTDHEPDFEALAPSVDQALRHLIGLPGKWLINVNFPPAPRGWRWTRQSVRAYAGQVVVGQDPMGRQLYWFTASPLGAPDEGTDRWAIAEGWTSLTPLRLSLTDEEQLRQWGSGGDQLPPAA